ncbi:MAG: hypothetical protein NC911_01620 [Candidatus Omnitrophica bacterium]|nr:hypothetical protein [Candidatus Omnitrophota bacterium]
MEGLLERYGNKVILLDTDSRWIYLGTLVAEDETTVTLSQADAFDLSETSLTRQEYLLRVKQDGLVPNRRRVTVLKAKVVGITLWEDILTV